MKGKVEDVELPEKADILISEPMGKLRSYIFHELNIYDDAVFIFQFSFDTTKGSG